MPSSCCAYACSNRLTAGKGVKFFRIPNADKNRRSQWIAAISRKNWEPKPHTRICSDHFISGRPSDDVTHPDYVPSIFKHRPVINEGVESRYHRSQKRQRVAREQEMIKHECAFREKKNVNLAAEALIQLCEESPRLKDKGCDAVPDALLDENNKLRIENKLLYDELARLQTELHKRNEDIEKGKFGVSYLDKLQPDQYKFYTGVNSSAEFHWVVNLVEAHLRSHNYITISDQVLLTLMKLRLNSLHQDLAVRFCITCRQVSTILSETIPALAEALNFLIEWPDTEINLINMPKSFKKNYPRCIVIIDCFEFFMERASNLTARAQTWSNYKHHNTMKVLVGITPTGAISFLSKCWGGRVSDKFITQHSGFYEKVKYGDQVLADRGFTINEELANVGAELILPAFTKGKKQLSKRERVISRQIARYRIHVERAIRRIKHFRILKEIFPISLQKYVDNIVVICSAITNLYRPLVSK